ncbi:MAG TPA: hypothetical protein VFL55_05605, partial [Acetobacteraceae bacterium]|nr:hypothetical protein [Acetobacteraceae bacterium]
MAVHHGCKSGCGLGDGSMGFTRANHVFAVELEDHFPGMHYTDDIRIHVGNRVAGDLERERPAARMSVLLAEVFEVVGYLTVDVGQDAGS